MVEEQIKKIVQPSITLVDTGNKGAKIHFFSDISCRVLHFGTPIAVTNAADTAAGSVVRLLKGNHKLEYKSIEHEDDAYSQDYYVPDNDYESFVNIELLPVKYKRKEQEEIRKAEEDRSAAEEKERRETMQSTKEQSRHGYDLYFCYARQDATIVRHVYQYFIKAGYRCWIDMDGLAIGDTYAETIKNVIQQSKCLLFFSSEHSNDESKWIAKEVLYAAEMHVKMITIKLDDTQLAGTISYFISTAACVDFTNKRYDDLNKLLETVRKAVDREFCQS